MPVLFFSFNSITIKRLQKLFSPPQNSWFREHCFRYKSKLKIKKPLYSIFSIHGAQNPLLKI